MEQAFNPNGCPFDQPELLLCVVLKGLDLDDEVLRKLYYKNALRVVPNIDKSLFPKD